MSYWEEIHIGTKLDVAVNHKISALFVAHVFKFFLFLPSFCIQAVIYVLENIYYDMLFIWKVFQKDNIPF